MLRRHIEIMSDASTSSMSTEGIDSSWGPGCFVWWRWTGEGRVEGMLLKGFINFPPSRSDFISYLKCSDNIFVPEKLVPVSLFHNVVHVRTCLLILQFLICRFQILMVKLSSYHFLLVFFCKKEKIFLPVCSLFVVTFYWTCLL